MAQSLPNPDAQEELRRFFEEEEFLAFFDFYLEEGGERLLSGLCKVARPKKGSAGAGINYLCLTFIVDTPTNAEQRRIEELMLRLTFQAFYRHLSNLHTVTSAPSMDRQAETYVHQLDLLFRPDVAVDPEDAIPAVMFTIREATGLRTAKPQWWEEPASRPKASALERANWSNRLRQLAKALGA